MIKTGREAAPGWIAAFATLLRLCDEDQKRDRLGTIADFSGGCGSGKLFERGAKA
jgi:hypothetical protein